MVNFGQILWEDFLQYVPKKSPKNDASELTFARFWSLYIYDLHKEAKVSMGDDTSLFITRDLKRYTPSKDQTIFGPLRHLPFYILESLGLSDTAVADHIVATSGLEPYHSTPPQPRPAVVPPTETHGPSPSAVRISSPAPLITQTETTSTPPKAKRVKILSKKKSKKHSSRVVIQETAVADKCKPTVSPEHHIPINDETSFQDSNDLFRRKKLKLTPSQSQMRIQTNTEISQQIPIVLVAPTCLLASTISNNSDSVCGSVSSIHGDNPPVDS